MLEDFVPPVTRRPCKLAKLAETLSEADALILWAAVDDDKSWRVKTLATSLTRRGFVISESPIGSHRNKSCGCFA